MAAPAWQPVAGSERHVAIDVLRGVALFGVLLVNLMDGFRVPLFAHMSGAADPLVDDNRAFAEKLRAAGAKVEHFIGEAMPHGFYFFPSLLGAGDAAFAAIGKFLSETRRGS